MQSPTEHLVYHAADGNAYQPSQLQELLAEATISLHRRTGPILTVADRDRVDPHRCRVRLRHPSPRPEDAFLEVEYSATLSLPADRCQPVGATGPSGAVSTVHAEALGVADEIPDQAEPVKWREGAFRSEVVTAAAAVEALEPVDGQPENDDITAKDVSKVVERPENSTSTSDSTGDAEDPDAPPSSPTPDGGQTGTDADSSVVDSPQSGSDDTPDSNGGSDGTDGDSATTDEEEDRLTFTLSEGP